MLCGHVTSLFLCCKFKWVFPLSLFYYVYFYVLLNSSHHPSLPPLSSQYKINFPCSKQSTIVCCDNICSVDLLFKLYLIGIVLWLTLLRTMLMFLTNIRFVTFNAKLCQLRSKTIYDMSLVPPSLTLLPLLLRNTDDIIETCLLCDGRNVIISITKSLPIIIQLMLPCCSILTKKCYKLIFMFLILCLNLTYSLGVIKIIQLIKILNTITQLCHFIPFWVPFLLIIMSNDTERNPGDNKLFTFCNWNLNSLTKDNFIRLNLLEAHNSLFNYDIISLCETNLIATVDLSSNLSDGFKSIFPHHPSGNKRGGVALFYKDNLPLVERNDLSFNGCIVTEIHIGRKKVFFTVDKAGSPEFDRLLNDLENLYIKIKYENPYAMFFTGDFNAHTQNW